MEDMRGKSEKNRKRGRNMSKAFVNYQGRIEAEVHRQAKMKAIATDRTLIEYINDCIKKDLEADGLIERNTRQDGEKVKQ